jgi:serine/threonine-protein kinase
VSAGAPESSGLSDAAPSNGAKSSSPSGPTSGFPRIDKYELLEEIGHGGMATVYRARDPRLGREVAVKVIHKHLRENPEVGTRFVAEARAAAKLRHPGIVDVFDVSGDEDAERYLVVELIRGTTLRKVLQKHRDMPAEVGAAIVLRVCDALEHAHATAIIHRDIKPENVLVELPADRAAASGRERESASATPPPARVTPQPPPATPSRPDQHSSESASQTSSGLTDPSDTQPSIADVVQPRGIHGHQHAQPKVEPRAKEPVKPRDDGGVVIKITDFGIAKILDAQGVTSTGQVLGSPAHMAPEQIEGGEVDPRTDVFALGVLMYECLVGHLPFEGKNPAQVLRRVLEGTYSPADRERPSVGGRWSRIVARALSRDAAERTPTAAALGEDIRRELDALGIADPKAEIEAYFADSEAYARALVDRLVPRLVARGEAARRTGDIPGAAADFNRALALRPDDLAVLKKLGSLTSSAGRQRLLRRAAAIVGGSAVLGLAAFQVARAWKASAGRLDPLPPASSSALDASDATARPAPDKTAPIVETAAVVPVSSGALPVDATVKRPRVPATPGFTPAPPPPPAQPGARMVYFNIVPKGAKLTVDSAPQSFLQAFSLSVGQHQIEVTPNVANCCKKLSKVIRVDPPPDGKPEHVQTIPLALEIQPAKVTLLGAPQNGQLSCTQLSLTCFAGAQQQITLHEPSWDGTCTFSAPDKPARKGRVRINAGETNAIPWPSGLE